MKDEWEERKEGVASYENDANDYYHEWVEIWTSEDENLVDLFKEWLDIGIDSCERPVIIRCRKGAILIECK